MLTRPPIKILRPLFTLQLLILPTRDPFQAHKKLKIRAKIEIFAFKLTHSMVKPQIEVKIAKILSFAPNLSIFGYEMGPSHVKLKVEE